MWREAAFLVIGCVLFISMGLSDEVQRRIGIQSKFLSCPKCLCFWSTLLLLLISGCELITAVCASFLFSYVAMWADLGLSMLNKKYNELYEQISDTEAAKTKPGKKRNNAKAGASRPGMSEVRRNHK